MATVWLYISSPSSGSAMLTILSMDESITVCFGACTETLVMFATSILNGSIGRTCILLFADIPCPFLTTVRVGSK